MCLVFGFVCLNDFGIDFNFLFFDEYLIIVLALTKNASENMLDA